MKIEAAFGQLYTHEQVVANNLKLEIEIAIITLQGVAYDTYQLNSFIIDGVQRYAYTATFRYVIGLKYHISGSARCVYLGGTEERFLWYHNSDHQSILKFITRKEADEMLVLAKRRFGRFYDHKMYEVLKIDQPKVGTEIPSNEGSRSKS